MTATAPKQQTVQDLQVCCETSTDQAEWDRYVCAHPRGAFFHRAGWLAVAREAYDYESLFLVARRAGAIVGVLPLIDVRAPLLGRSLISTAFTVGGGPLADDDHALTALLDAACEIGVARNARYIECRSDFDAGPDWRAKPSTSSGFTLPVIADEIDALTSIPKRRRADLRKAINSAIQGALRVRHDGDPELFYKFYASSMHRLGTPVYPKKFIYSLVENFTSDLTISIAEIHGAPVGALLSFHHGSTILPYYVGAAEQARSAFAFDYIYWRLTRLAAERGYAKIDFGRSRNDSGPYIYKKLWGMEPEPLTYRIKLIGAVDMPDVNAKNPKFEMLSQAWRRLPLAAANAIGPIIARNFP